MFPTMQLFDAHPSLANREPIVITGANSVLDAKINFKAAALRTLLGSLWRVLRPRRTAFRPWRMELLWTKHGTTAHPSPYHGVATTLHLCRLHHQVGRRDAFTLYPA